MAKDEDDPLLADPDEPQTHATPPKPRDAGTGSHTQDEDKLVAQIEADDNHESFDTDIENQREHESPMHIIGEKKKSWLHIFKRPKFWISFSFSLLIIAILAWLITPSRLWLLNTIGLKSTVTVTTVVVTSEGTPPTLKNTTVVINGQTFQTNDQGQVRAAIAYGSLHIEASKAGYESVVKDELLDFDPFFNKLGGAQADTNIRNPVLLMKNVGVTVGFVAKDWLSGLPVTTGTFSVGDVTAHPNGDGKVTLSLPATDAKTVTVTAAFEDGYTNKQIELAVGDTAQEVAFVPVGTHYFISKRGGNYAVYGSKLDGSEVTEVVPQAASETGDMTFSASPDGKYGILGSTREATRDSFGTVQQTLFVVDLATKKLTSVDTALRFDLVDWSANSLVYVASYRSGNGQMVQRLSSVNAAQIRQANIGADTTYKTVRVCLGSVVYVRADGELRTVPVAGGTEKSLGTQVQQFTQANATTFAYQIAGSWHSYDVNANQVSNAQTPTSVNRAFLAARSADGQNYLVVDTVDGTPTLFTYAAGNNKETRLFAGSGITAPIRWVGNVAVYRVGSTDFALSPRGGQSKKITDVTPSPNTHVYPSFN
ncbi:MAG TPA: hypothetical protein VM581_01075 [Magnetospirillaceae bacterium]|nr:hypothetical protein [Magnetospirillaceae bacterium]